MMRAAVFTAALALAACAAQAPQTAAPDLAACAEADRERTGGLTPGECQLQASGQTLRVTYADVAAGAEAGAISVDVLGDDGRVVQTLLEADVPEYMTPQVEDIDGDGHADILIARVLGNVNFEWGVWIYNGERQRYERVGEISGVETRRTADGLIAVPSRSSAASWNVRYYRLDRGELQHLVTAQIDGIEHLPDGRVRSTCSISEAPGLGELQLDARAARARFCAEPASQVFRP